MSMPQVVHDKNSNAHAFNHQRTDKVKKEIKGVKSIVEDARKPKVVETKLKRVVGRNGKK